jgi:hypothetical protein
MFRQRINRSLAKRALRIDRRECGDEVHFFCAVERRKPLAFRGASSG